MKHIGGMHSFKKWQNSSSKILMYWSIGWLLCNFCSVLLYFIGADPIGFCFKFFDDANCTPYRSSNSYLNRLIQE